MKGRSADKIQMSSFDELFHVGESGDGEKGEKVQEIALCDLSSFQNHPFKVSDDEKMQDMVQSIQEYGVLNPLLVRPKKTNGYEMISGHRRKYACEKAGIKTVPCIVRELSDEEAVILMVDSNIQREELLFSEKAYAYKMKLEAMNRQGKRTDLASCQLGAKSGERSDSELGNQCGESARQIHRYIRLTELSKSFLDKVDKKQLPFNVGVEISYLNLAEQEMLLKVMEKLAAVPNLAQAVKMKQLSKEKKLDETGMELLLSQEKPLSGAFKLERKKLNEYFPKDYTEEQKEQIIYELLKKWSYENNTE